MFTVSSKSIGIFKTGDNINYNLRVLAILYTQYESASDDEKRLLCKPITILLISIIEAMLHDFHVRCNHFRWEGVANVADDAMSYIRTKKIDKLSRYIQSAKRHDLLGDNEGHLYEHLELLNKLRNRIHIQNEYRDLEENEWSAFTPQRKLLAEQVLERVMKLMVQRHPRPEHASGFVADFSLPWNEHFPSGKTR
jgi:hypothetical protein